MPVTARFEQRIVALEGKFEQRFIQVEAKLDTKLDGAVAEHAFAHLNAKIDSVAADLRTTFERGLKDQVCWLYLTWGTLLLTIIGLWSRR